MVSLRRIFGILLAVASTASQISATNYIINGDAAPHTPHHAHIRIHARADVPNGDIFIGSGALISAKHVLTCAQNLFGFELFEVGLGSVVRKELIFFESTRVIIHPDYNPETLMHNIGVIVFREPLAFTDDIRPIQLVAPNTVLPFPAEQGVITGFGLIHGNQNRFPSHLQRGFHRVLTASECHWRYPHLANVSTTTHFCGLDDDHQQTNICGGDQGTAFALGVRGVWTLVGIASFTERQCVQELGAVYVRVSTYRQWIFNETGL